MSDYHASWIGYEEGHQEEDFKDCDGYLTPIYHWVEDFYIRLDMQAFRIGNRNKGVNMFWGDFIHPKRWRVLRSTMPEAWGILYERLR